jgi:hypothetical protein
MVDIAALERKYGIDRTAGREALAAKHHELAERALGAMKDYDRLVAAARRGDVKRPEWRALEEPLFQERDELRRASNHSGLLALTAGVEVAGRAVPPRQLELF